MLLSQSLAAFHRRIELNWRKSSYFLRENDRREMNLAGRPNERGSLRAVLAMVGLCLATVQAALAQLPPGWTDEDIGAPSFAGSASYNAGTWNVAGGGSDIWNAADQFNFAFTNATDSTVIIARVLSLDETDPWAKAGVMIRDDDTPGAMYADVVVAP